MTNNFRGAAFGISLAAGVAHVLATVTAATYFILLLIVPLDVDSIGTAFAIFLLLPIAIVILIFVVLPQLCFGIGIIASAACGKKKLCTVFCGIPLLADLIAVIFAIVVGMALTGDISIVITIVMFLFGALSLAAIVLSITAMAKNLSKKNDVISQ